MRWTIVATLVFIGAEPPPRAGSGWADNEDLPPAVRAAAVVAVGLAAAPGDESLSGPLRRWLADRDPTVARVAAWAVGQVRPPDAAELLIEAVRGARAAETRAAAAQALERLGPAPLDRLVELAESGLSTDLDRAVDAALALRSPAAPATLLRLLPNPHLSIARRADLAAGLGRFADADPRPLIEYLRRHPDEPPAVRRAAALALARMDRLTEHTIGTEQVERGRKLMASAGCAKCHRDDARGPGPSLASGSLTAGQALAAIVEPAADIRPGFELWKVENSGSSLGRGTRGKSPAGADELRQADGRAVVPPKTSVWERQPGSLMPADFAARLTIDELLDLAAAVAAKR